MAAKISDYKTNLYHREYSNDAPPQTDLLKRIALAAAPFLSLHRSFQFPVALGMGSLRVINTQDKVQTVIAVAALVSTIFRYQFGQVLTTVQDIVLEANSLRLSGNKEEAVKSLIKIFNNLVYLALITQGGLELYILSLAIQTVINLINSRDEFKNDRWIEGCANLLMAGIKLQQTHTQIQQLKRNWEIEAAIKKFHVGELHEKWQFPSDHLPVGVEVDGVRIISWNVLNNAYIEWVTDKDSQGLNGSMISDLNKPVGNGLTLRDLLVADMVESMMSKGHVVALQECSNPFIELLQQRLPANWEMVKSFDSPQVDQAIILYDSVKLSYCQDRSETATSAYESFPSRPLQNAFFSNNKGTDLRIINAHIPGDPLKPGREEFANYVHKQHQNDSVTVALGDNNFERDEMIDAYRKAGFSEFSVHSPWKTNIDPYSKQSKGIDHFFIIGTDSSRDLRADEVLQNGNLQETIDLLNPK